MFRVVRGVAKDRVIPTVDLDARHGQKTAARGFDGYKGHVAIDPGSELIVSTHLGAGNIGDAAAVQALLAQDLPATAETSVEQPLPVFGDSAYGTGQDRAQDRSGRRHGDLPCRSHREAADARERAGRALRRAMRRLPAGIAVPCQPPRAQHSSRPPRTAARCGACPPGRPGLEDQLHQPTTQDRAPDATQTRRPARQSQRPKESRRRLHIARRRGQPRPLQRARPGPPTSRTGDQHSMTEPNLTHSDTHDHSPLTGACPAPCAQQRTASAAGLRQRQSQGERQPSLLPRPI